MFNQTGYRAVIGGLALTLVCSPALLAQNEIRLPKPDLKGSVSVAQAMANKKTVRQYKGTPLTLQQVSQLLWVANGDLPRDAISGATLKVMPSAGGLYPLEVFLVAGQGGVAEVPAGVYQYNPRKNVLELTSQGDKRNLLANAALGQMWLARAPAVVLIGAIFERTTMRYGSRGVNYVMMEAGSANQNIYLEAESLGISAGGVGAFDDGKVASVLSLPSSVKPLLLVAVGK
ncbi:MAG: SagB/ThcOx family dehydrogenase [Deltaproteobacteria bacterium]|nr:SagB/ThcOx family dehydrogenase [Deltaproteobacteria bacterium]